MTVRGGWITKPVQIRLFIVVLLVGLGIRLAIFSDGKEQLIRIIPDDTFYYLETAKHIIAGDGSTFDGINPADGYHPLWMVLLLPLNALVSDPWSMLYLTLIIGLIFNIGATILLFVTLRRCLNVWYVPVIGAAIYFLNAGTIVNNNGLEVMVSSFFFALALYLSINDYDFSAELFRRKALLGLCLGLLFLARTDNAFYILAFFAVAIWRTPPIRRIKAAVLIAGIGALVVSPWVVWHIIKFGTPFQSSGFALPYVIRESYLAEGHTYIELLIRGARFFLRFITEQIYGSYLRFPKLIYILIMIGTIYMIVRKWKRLNEEEYLESGRIIKLMIPLVIASLALIFIHTFIRLYPRGYYFDQMVIMSAVGFSLFMMLLRPQKLLVGIRADKAPRSTLIGIALVILAAMPALYEYPKLKKEGMYGHQVEFYDAAIWLKENTPPESVAAGFNVGITSYFSDRTVINLDGAINVMAVEAIRQKRLLEYIEEMNVDYIVDYDPIMFKMYRFFLGEPPAAFQKEVVAKFDHPDVSWYGSEVYIFALKY